MIFCKTQFTGGILYSELCKTVYLVLLGCEVSTTNLVPKSVEPLLSYSIHM